MKMSDANAYYQSLLQQGYDVNQAAVYTKEHYPDFVALGAAPAPPPAAPAAPAQSSLDPNMMAMMMMQQQSQQAMMQQQTMLAQSQQSQPAAGVAQTIAVHAHSGSGVPAKDATTGYLLWCCCFLMLCGLHRFYYNRPISGIVYLFTFGLFGFGQLYDLLIIQELARTAPRY